MDISEFEELIYTVEDGAAWIRFNRPEQMNSFTSRLYGEVKWAVRQAQADPNVDIIVITGSGQAFATGGDLKETLELLKTTETPTERSLLGHKFFDAVPWNDMRDCPKTIIGAINGYCMAGGLITAAWCDISIAAESATFSLPEAKVGVAETWSSAVLFGRVPFPKLKYLLFTGKRISADEAERIGFVTEVVPDSALESRVREVIGEVRETSPVARALFKDYLHDLVPRFRNAGKEAFEGGEIVEGLSAFKEKRQANY